MPAHAYVEVLHQRMTREAFRLATQQSAFLKDLGVSTDEQRSQILFEIAEGAFDEDRGVRSLNHFLEPGDGKALTVPVLVSGGLSRYSCAALGLAANERALRIVSAARVQHYRVWTASTDDERQAAIEDLFHMLGQAMHLVQDMAQPEHTRNDQHRFAAGAAAASLYEQWTGDNLVRITRRDGTPTDGYFKGFKLPRRQSQSLWSYDQLFSNPAGDGLADLTSRNYVTQDTNYSDLGAYDEKFFPRCIHYGSPVLPEKPSPQRFVITVRDAGGKPKQLDFIEEIYSSSYPYPGGVDEDGYHTIRSALDHETVKYNPKVRVFSLDDNSWNTRAANLLPKAVGYSAGVLTYFFRNSGSIGASWHANTNGSYNIGVTNEGAEPILNARVEIFARDPEGNLRKLASKHFNLIDCKNCGSNEVEMVVSIRESQAHVVIRGDIGDERGAVIGLLTDIRR
jgi:hypothetical protein